MVTKYMTRAYQMGARAQAVQARRDRIVEAAYDLLTSRSLDELTLEAIAQEAGVSLKTVVRQFKTRDDSGFNSPTSRVVVPSLRDFHAKGAAV